MLNREKLAENLITFVPLLHKKLLKGFPECEISKQQLGLLFQISKADEKPMSYYSEKIMVPKSNITVMADKLIELDFIERILDPNDRRIVTLKITDKGKECLHKFKEKVRQGMVERLGLLDDKNIDRLNEIIEEMKVIFEKIEK